MRQEHLEQIDRWAEYCRTHNDWKEKLNLFLDSQIIIARRVYSKLAKTEKGRKTIRSLKNLD